MISFYTEAQYPEEARIQLFSLSISLNIFEKRKQKITVPNKLNRTLALKFKPSEEYWIGFEDFNRTAVILDTSGKNRVVDPSLKFYALCKPASIEGKSRGIQFTIYTKIKYIYSNHW